MFGWPDQEEETTKYSIEIPNLSSLILTHELDGEVKGLKEWPKDERPPVALVFWTFRIMVGLGVLMVITGVMATMHLGARYETLLAIHILSVCLLLVYIPFGKMMHFVLVFITRSQTGAHLSHRGAQQI